MFFERLQRDEKTLWFFGIKVAMEVFFSRAIHDTDVHRVGVKIDSAVEFVLFVVKFHIMFFLGRAAESHEPLRLRQHHADLLFTVSTVMDEVTRSSKDMISFKKVHRNAVGAAIYNINWSASGDVLAFPIHGTMTVIASRTLRFHDRTLEIKIEMPTWVDADDVWKCEFTLTEGDNVQRGHAFGTDSFAAVLQTDDS